MACNAIYIFLFHFYSFIDFLLIPSVIIGFIGALLFTFVESFNLYACFPIKAQGSGWMPCYSEFYSVFQSLTSILLRLLLFVIRLKIDNVWILSVHLPLNACYYWICWIYVVAETSCVHCITSRRIILWFKESITQQMATVDAPKKMKWNPNTTIILLVEWIWSLVNVAALICTAFIQCYSQQNILVLPLMLHWI